MKIITCDLAVEFFLTIKLHSCENNMNFSLISVEILSTACHIISSATVYLVFPVSLMSLSLGSKHSDLGQINQSGSLAARCKVQLALEIGYSTPTHDISGLYSTHSINR